MSISAEIEALKAKLAELEAKKAAASQVQIKDLVSFPFGRGESKVTKQGIIVGVSDDGKQVRIISGKGFTTEALTAYRSQCEKVTIEVPAVAEATLDDSKPDAPVVQENVPAATEPAFDAQQTEAKAEGDANVAAAQAAPADINLDDLPI